MTDLEALVGELRAQGARFRNDIVTGVGGKQLLLDDPSENPVELFEPTRPRCNEPEAICPGAGGSPNTGRRQYGAGMVSLDEAARMAMDLPHVEQGERHGTRSWSVAGKTFAWERSFSKADIRRFGDATPPDGPILAVRVADLGEKEAVLASEPTGFFTIPHFDGFSAVLIQLKAVTKRALREALLDGWLACAPLSLADEYLKKESG